MKALLCLLPVVALALSSCSTPSKPPVLTAVDKVDAKRYSGTWYEIARFPSEFEADVHYVQSRYKLNRDGTLSIRNQARTPEGVRVSSGVATPVPGANGSKYRIKFNSFEGDYWVVGVDPNYRWAIVSEPTRSHLWFIAKSPKVSAASLDEMKRIATEKGYDVSQLEMVKQ